MLILAIETSCDETSLALVEATGGLRAPRFRVIKNLISSQIPVHRPFGGVVPTLAKREHIRNLPLLYKKLIAASSSNSKCKVPPYGRSPGGRQNAKLAVDVIAATVGPGLEPALWAGIEFAKDLAKKLGVPLVGANHIEAHLYSFLLPQKTTTHVSRFTTHVSRYVFPAVALIVSGGHTILLYMQSLTKWKKLGETRDDAAGEAFDKVARMLGLPYPGGPEIERLAKKGNPAAIPFPRPMLAQKNYDFSFAGLKTAVLYYLKKFPRQSASSPRKSADAANIAASFQRAVIDTLVGKTMRAAQEYNARSVFLSGGVAANQTLRQQLAIRAKRSAINFLAPSAEFNTDNAAMIAAAAYINIIRKKKYRLTAQPNLNL